jgi:hypothetical protein
MFYDVTYEDVPINFQILVIDSSNECRPRSNLNFVECIWKYLVLAKFKMYAIVAITYVTPKILYLKHHKAASECWITNLLCDLCLCEFKVVLVPIISNCNFVLIFKCNMSYIRAVCLCSKFE